MDEFDFAHVVGVVGVGLRHGTVAPALVDEEAGGLDGGMGIAFLGDLDEASVDGVPVIGRDGCVHLGMALGELGVGFASGTRARTTAGHWDLL